MRGELSSKQGMIFTRILPFAVLAGLASAQLTQIQRIIDSLDSSVKIIGPRIITLVATHQDNDTSIGQQLDQLITVFNTATTDLNEAAPPAASAKFKRQNSADDESTFEGFILSDITQALVTIDPNDAPSFPGRIPAIDKAISQEILAFGKAIGGNLSLVANFSAEVQHIWQNLTMTLSRQALGFA